MLLFLNVKYMLLFVNDLASATVFVAHPSGISKEGEIVSPDCPKLPIIGKDSKPKSLL